MKKERLKRYGDTDTSFLTIKPPKDKDSKDRQTNNDQQSDTTDS